jgi:hypothetical protein
MRREALLRHPLAIAGALIATVATVLFIVLIIAALAGLFRNPYAGLVVFVALPAALVLGLLLIPIGVWLDRRALQRARLRDPEAVLDWPIINLGLARVRRVWMLIIVMTAVNLGVLLFAGYGALHWMESPTFCGQVCHTPMHPQFTAWSAGPHARTPCVACHIGEGASGFIHAKLAGVRQLAHVATGSYPRPVPPGAHMDPGAQAETCTSCHQPARLPGDRIRIFREYSDDEANTETATPLQVRLGEPSTTERAIHWHANPAVRVEYIATDARRETIPYVKVTDARGRAKEFRAPNASASTDGGVSGERRTMDCVDCHNAVGHPMAASAERAVDGAIAAGLVDRQLPFVRREGVRLLKASYASDEEATRAIDAALQSFYTSRADIDGRALARSVSGLQEAYRRNVFPAMKVAWGAYPNQLGHTTSTGCFRCHDGEHAAADGSVISADCEYCHK